MELVDFLKQIQAQVRAEICERMENTSSSYPYPETVFAEVVMQHMADIGMTFDDPEICYFQRTIGNARLHLTGYAISDEADHLDLFVTIYVGVDEILPINDSETKQAADRCLQFLKQCVGGRLIRKLEESDDAYSLIMTVQECYSSLDQIRIYVLTDRHAKAKNFKPREIEGKTIKLEVMDIERLHRHLSEGKPRDEITIDFNQICGSALPCIFFQGEFINYDYALTAFPGEALRFLYDKYGGRLLEANVRSFLSVTGKINRGIRDTVKNDPERFMAYNNGIVIVADEIEVGQSSDGGPGILWLKGMQIVNGGQTTASIYFTKKKNPETDLSRIRVPAKIIILRTMNPLTEENLISDISRYANSQNSVRLSDLSANKPFHIELEKLSTTIYCQDGAGKWFYERAAGSYNVMLAREGTTPARLRQLKESIPTSRKITKTDLAKYLNAWDQKPDLVSLGSQKNFEKFMERINNGGDGQSQLLPDAQFFKQMVAKAILFKKTQSVVRPLFKAYQANVTTYLISLIANRLGTQLDLDRIWERQGISPELRCQIQTWASEVNDVLHRTSSGRMISEWAKKPECWTAVRTATFSPHIAGIPELRKE